MTTTTTVKLHFPSTQPIPPHSDLSKARRFAADKAKLDAVQAKMLEIAQPLVELDNVEGVDFNPHRNELTVVGRTTGVRPPVLDNKTFSYVSGRLAAQMRWKEDGELTYLLLEQHDDGKSDNGSCTYRFERHDIRVGIPFINRHSETVQDYEFSGSEVQKKQAPVYRSGRYGGSQYVDHYDTQSTFVSSSARLRMNESNGKLTCK